MTTNPLWIFGLRVLPATPSLCTSFAPSSFALHPTSFLFLSLTFEVQTIPSLMLCPVFRCSGSANSSRRQIWNPLPCLPQHRPSGKSPSLSAVSSHCTFQHAAPTPLEFTSTLPSVVQDSGPHSLHRSYSYVILPLGSPTMSASQPLSSIWLVFGLPTSKTAL